MGKATGVFLILAGIGTAALVLPQVDKDAERQLADVVQLATGGSPSGSTPSDGHAPATSWSPPPVASVNRQEKAVVAAATVDAARAPLLVTPPQAVIRNTAPVARSADLQVRQALSRDIQLELKRVGCYDGEVTGEWNQRTRSAMKAFIDRVNAALPVDEPDNILRTMVQGHPGHACGRPTNGGSGSVVAQVTQPRVALARDALASSRDATSLKPAVPRPAWETTVAAAPVVPSQPFSTEGRMAIGAPLPAPTTAPNGAARTATVELSPVLPRDGRNSTPRGPAANGLVGLIVPGAIAAFGSRSSGPTAAPSGPRTDVALAAPNADGVVSGVTAVAPRAVVKRERPRPAIVQRQPEKYRFPPPSYVGARVSNYEPYYRRPAGVSSFSHFFEHYGR